MGYRYLLVSIVIEGEWKVVVVNACTSGTVLVDEIDGVLDEEINQTTTIVW